ncbi:MAG: alpha-amylase family glycosyl hydrolase [Candidatus Marinimicrobia bacterium]|nr:alpha-amylase family glycosyl hydrolase [Candidatus Neomarinimicrobiota bacterium]MDD5708981.1 alpha-amylase family glycosyl hydrolase [Candidatus Neomarinimicrobiota bacterium]
MRKIAFLMCVLTIVAYAQNPVYSDPAFSTENDSIIVYYDATMGNQALKDYSGTLYAHTGVMIEGSSQWEYVWTSWPSTNVDKNKLLKISDNLYKLVIGYPHEYYSCPDSVKILKLAFVFRSTSGSPQSEDLFITLYEPGITTAWLQPAMSFPYGAPERSPLFIPEEGESQRLVAGVSDVADSIFLFLNEHLIHTETNRDSLIYDLSAAELQTGLNYLKAVAVAGELRDTTDNLCVAKYAANSGTRPAGLQDGITVNSGSSVSLSLFAPYKEFIYVIGDFNDWKIDPDYQMKKDIRHTDSTWFWINLQDLPAGELGFQYLVDGEIRIADPYSPLILDPWNDEYISETRYPGLKAYPKDKTAFPVGVLNTDPPAFNWTDQDFVRPAKDELVIYELLIRDWSYIRTYQALIDSINYFKRLGITAIELMPVQEFEGNESWGYNPMFHFAPDKYYGPAHKLKELVNLCHNNGIAVILDVVYNHATGQNPLVRLYNEGDYGKPTAENPWFNTGDMHPFSVFYDMDHENKATQYYLDRANRYWIEEFHIDGYRFDLSKGFTQRYSGSDVNYWGQYDAGRIALLKRMANRIWEFDPGAYVILEHFSENSEELELAHYGMMLWGNGNHNYSEASMGYLGSSDLSWLYHGSRGWSYWHVVGYMESHDEERITFKNKEYGNSAGTYNIKYLNNALDRMELAAVFLLSLPGPKLIWQFGELGYDYSIDYNGRTGNKPIKWDYYRVSDRRDVYNLYSAMNFLRANYKTFGAATGVELYVGNNVAAKRIKLSGDSPNAVVLGNFDVVSQAADPAFHHAGPWYEYFNDDTLNVSNTNEGILLAPGEYRIYTDQKLMSPPVARTSVLPRSFELKQNYPNPFNPQTWIAYRLTADNPVELSVYDLQGQKVRTLVNSYQSAGEYEVVFNGEGLSSGVYFYRLNSGRHRETRKMLYMK